MISKKRLEQQGLVLGAILVFWLGMKLQEAMDISAVKKEGLKLINDVDQLFKEKGL